MKNLKFGLFSLLAILAVSVFLTSCEQNEPIPNLSEVNITENNDEATYYRLPDSFGDMSVEELNDFLQDKTAEEILDMAVEVLDNNLEFRWCNSPVTYYTSCQYSGTCGGRRTVKFKKRYCDSIGWFYYTTLGSCC